MGQHDRAAADRVGERNGRRCLRRYSFRRRHCLAAGGLDQRRPEHRRRQGPSERRRLLHQRHPGARRRGGYDHLQRQRRQGPVPGRGRLGLPGPQDHHRHESEI